MLIPFATESCAGALYASRLGPPERVIAAGDLRCIG